MRLNPEKTGTLVLLGQEMLARGDGVAAEKLLAHACQVNPRAANAFYFRGFIAWKKNDLKHASAMLEAARQARGAIGNPLVRCTKAM